ncbi:MAG: glycosyltransferase [Lachnospiraceae bacterium]
MEPLISIIVPVYNVEAYLKRCVESLRAQTYRNLEIILVDDGSPDNCPAICDAYGRQDKRIQVIHQKNMGLSGARNSGIDIAKGSYLAFVDSDDYVAPDFIQSLYELLRETGCSIGQCRFTYVQGKPLDAGKGRSFQIFQGERLMEQLYGPEEEATFFVVAWNKLYRRELFEHIRYPLGRIHEDEATTYRLFHKGGKLAFLDCALYGYYTGNDGSITAHFSGKRLQWLEAHEERISFFKENGYEWLLPRAYRKLCDACVTFYFRCTDEVENAEQIRKELKSRLKEYQGQGAGWIRELPLKTRIGYQLFNLSPVIYAKLLKRMQESSL